MATLNIRTEDFYDTSPSVDHVSGDIWRGLPTFGLLPSKLLPGIVVTPACDLSNSKTETITYLPIMDVRSIICGPPFRRYALQGLREALDAADLRLEFLEIDRRLLTYTRDEFNSLEIRVREVGLNATKQTRILTAIEYVRLIVENDPKALRAEHFGKHAQRIMSNIARNAERADLHFLPPDELIASRSLLSKPSCALLRYPITIPIDLLDAANDLRIGDWQAATNSLSDRYAAATAFIEQPLKMLTLRGEFFSDLISRYLALYLRLGSRDLSAKQIDRYVGQIV
ncbi:MAG: hypothetical protein IAI50_16735 [Candidatus Eremiobacteraeota bacterium]|nr:hypothetical protein [Candidatus Eremiobacteraeota bacterium]